MANTEALLKILWEGATADELRPVGLFIGECVARRDTQALAPFYDRARHLRQTVPSGTWLRGFLDTVTAYLDGYFGAVEPTLRIEKLARELEGQPLWREILRALHAKESLNQEEIRESLRGGVASSKSAVSIALEELRARELVEHIPGNNRRERIHMLTRRGHALCAACGFGLKMQRVDDAAHPTADPAGMDESKRPRRPVSEPPLKAAEHER